LLLPDTQLEGAITVAENLRQRLAKQTLSDSAEKLQLGTITVSCGVAELNKNDDIKSFNKRAEALLSAARFEGGNRVQS
jgi:diguanylate cyclase